MRRILYPLIAVLAIGLAQETYADDAEDLKFAEELLRRKWLDWAEEVVVRLVEKASARNHIRSQAAELHIEIIMVWKKVGGRRAPATDVAALKKKYKRMFFGRWPGTTLLDRLEEAIELAKQSETEPDVIERGDKKKKVVTVLKELSPKFEAYIRELRLAVAKYPPSEKWQEWAKTAPKKEQDQLLSHIRRRNTAEYLYAMSFLYYARVGPEDKKKENIEKAIKKFVRITDGEQEHDKDFDPPPLGINKPIKPEVRDTYVMLLYRAEIGIGRCYLELGEYEKAVEHFEYMIEAELPKSLEYSQADLECLVDIRLEAYYLDGLAYNRWKKHKEAEKVLNEMFKQSNKPIQPDRPEVLEHWKKRGRKEVALMPYVQKTEYGRLAVLELGKALIAQKRYLKGFENALWAFETEKEKNAEGKLTRFAVEAANTAAAGAEKYLLTLPEPQKRTKKQREQNLDLKIRIADIKYITGDYRAAAKMFDVLRRTVRCPECGYEEVLDIKDFDKPMKACPKCNKEKVKLEKVNNNLLKVVEGAAKSYLAIFEKLDNKDMESLDRAQDIYQRIFKRLDPSKENQLPKYWEVGYIILKIYYYNGDLQRIIGLLPWPPDEAWDLIIPVQPWRDKVKKLYKKALKALEEDK
jgi:tetratricopeptide (TPR) repeat protein